jgi:hypothetical protein
MIGNEAVVAVAAIDARARYSLSSKILMLELMADS